MNVGISVICPLYKGQKYVDKIIRMLERNREQIKEVYFVELVFINDYPKEAVSIPSEHLLDNIMLIENSVNVGIHQSRVNGMNVSSGEYLLFLDQDDIIEDNYLKEQLKYIGGADCVVSNGIWRKIKTIYENIEQQNDVICKRRFFLDIVSPGQVLLKRSAIPAEWEAYIMEHNGCDDMLLWNLMKGSGKVFACNEKVLYTHVEENENASCNFVKMYASLIECLEIFERVNKHLLMDKLYMYEREKKIVQYKSYIRLEECLENVQIQKIYDYLRKEGINTIAIYGFGYFGQCLYSLLKNNEIDVAYIVDRDKKKYKLSGELIMYHPSDIFPECDLMLVTPILEYDNIREEVEKMISGKVLPMNFL